jgi:hypothetical protein
MRAWQLAAPMRGPGPAAPGLSCAPEPTTRPRVSTRTRTHPLQERVPVLDDVLAVKFGHQARLLDALLLLLWGFGTRARKGVGGKGAGSESTPTRLRAIGTGCHWRIAGADCCLTPQPRPGGMPTSLLLGRRRARCATHSHATLPCHALPAAPACSCHGGRSLSARTSGRPPCASPATRCRSCRCRCAPAGRSRRAWNAPPQTPLLPWLRRILTWRVARIGLRCQARPALHGWAGRLLAAGLMHRTARSTATRRERAREPLPRRGRARNQRVCCRDATLGRVACAWLAELRGWAHPPSACSVVRQRAFARAHSAAPCDACYRQTRPAWWVEQLQGVPKALK